MPGSAREKKVGLLLPDYPEKNVGANSTMFHPSRHELLHVPAANHRDDFIHRGHASLLKNMNFYTYSTSIHRREKRRLEGHEVTFTFEEHYVLSGKYIQELRHAPSIPENPSFAVQEMEPERQKGNGKRSEKVLTFAANFGSGGF